MLRIAPIAALAMLSACTGETGTREPGNKVSAEQAEPAAEVPQLAGEWRLSKIDGRDAAGLGMTASFADGQARLVTGCFRRAWTYSQKRNIVSFKTSPGGSSNCGGGTPGSQAETAYAALERSTIAIFAKGGKEASLSGTGGNLTLERR